MTTDPHPPLESAADQPSLEGAFDEDGVDLTQMRWMLSLDPTERLAAAQSIAEVIATLRVDDGD